MKTRKKLSLTTKILISVGLIPVILVAGYIVYAEVYFRFFPISARNLSISINNVSVTTSAQTGGNTTTNSDLNKAINDPTFFFAKATSWYSSVSASLKGTKEDQKAADTCLTNEVFRFENEQYCTAYFFDTGGTEEKGIPGLQGFIFEKKDGRYSNSLYGNLLFLYPNALLARYKFDLKSTVAYDIAMGSAIPTNSMTSLPNDGAPTFVGISLDPAVKNLRIMGRPPTEIVQFDVQGTPCYVWVYKELDVAGYLKKSKDIGSGSFTLGKLIDALDIHFAPSDDPLSKEVTITTVP